MLITSGGTALAAPAPSHHAGGAVMRLMTGAVQAVRRWIERRSQLRALADLDDDLLKDIGLTRKDVQRARSQSFWMPRHRSKRDLLFPTRRDPHG